MAVNYELLFHYEGQILNMKVNFLISIMRVCNLTFSLLVNLELYKSTRFYLTYTGCIIYTYI